LRPRGVRVPVPQQPVRTPQASRRAVASPKHYLRTFTSFSNPPRSLQPSRPKPFNHGTRDLCSHACVEWVDNGMAEGENAGYKQSKERSRITQIKAGCRWHTFPTSRSSWSEGANVEARSLSTLFPTPFGTATRASESPSTMKHDACAVAHVSDGLDEGRSRGGRDTTERWVSKIDASPWPACSCSTTTGCYPDPRPGGEDRREERGTRGFLG